MILSLAIIINAALALVLIGGLAYAMSRTKHLTPHFAVAEVKTASDARSSRPAQSPRARRQHSPAYVVRAAAISSKA